MSDKVRVAAVATRVRRDEAEQIESLPAAFGKNMAEKLRVLIRFGLDHTDDVEQWLADVEGQPA